MWHCSCNQGGEVLASTPDKDAGGIWINRKTGLATNLWDDGTSGVPEEYKKMAEDDDSPLCLVCGECCTWVGGKK